MPALSDLPDSDLPDSDLRVFDLIDLMTGYQSAATLTAASRLGVFSTLGETPSSFDDVARLLATEPLATRALLDALVGLRLVRSIDGGYVSVPITTRLAVGGDLHKIVEKEAFFARQWLDLADSVRTGAPRIASWRERLVSDPDQVRSFLDALVVLAVESGPDLTTLPGFTAGLRVADFGGGLGPYSTQMAAAGAEVTLVELPEVAPWAREAVDAGDGAAAQRILVQGQDLLAADAAPALLGTSPGGFDLVLLSHLLHDLTDDDCATVLRVAYEVLAPAGRVVVFELPGDPPGAFGPMFDLMMRVETAGRARHVAELAGLIALAGFSDVAEAEGFRRPHGVVTGFKR
jgi:SAM-dependent methyltransferase